jgi:hypothetical protein
VFGLPQHPDQHRPGSVRSSSQSIPLQMCRVRADEAWDGWPAMSGWEDVYPDKLEEFPGTKRPTPQQISDAMARVHKARREILPPADEFLDTPIDPRLTAWLTKLEWNRVRYLGVAREDHRGARSARR